MPKEYIKKSLELYKRDKMVVEKEIQFAQMKLYDSKEKTEFLNARKKELKQIKFAMKNLKKANNMSKLAKAERKGKI
jgi:hypothetical protein